MINLTLPDKMSSIRSHFRKNGKAYFLMALVLVAGCASEEDKLNTKLANQPLKERLVTLQQQCSEVAHYSGATPLSDDPQYKFLLPKLCDGMGVQILRIEKTPHDENIAADFDNLFKNCMAESHNKSIRWGRHSHNLNYAFKAEAICDVYQEEFLKLHPKEKDQPD